MNRLLRNCENQLKRVRCTFVDTLEKKNHGAEMRNCRIAQCGQVNPIQLLVECKGPKRQLPILHDRTERRSHHGAGSPPQSIG